MKIILKKDIENLGLKYEKLEVKSGYARNFLIPKGLAVLALPGIIKNTKEVLKQRYKKEKFLIYNSKIIEQKLKKLSIIISVKTGENGKLFGSINNYSISNILNKNGINVDKKFIKINGKNIKAVGNYSATISLHKDHDFIIKFKVQSKK